MDCRVETYQALINWTPLTDIVGKRIHGASSVNHNADKPLIVIRMHTEFQFSAKIGGRGYVQVWAHDEPGDYMRIDKMISEVKKAMVAIPQHEDFLEAEWIETSTDLRDDFMNTICRYCRFQLTGTTRELV